MTTRETFLHPPQPEHLSNVPATLRDSLRQANETLDQTHRHPPAPDRTDRFLSLEAICSSAIEGVTDPQAVILHRDALRNYLYQPITDRSLLDLHQHIMHRQEHAQPGRYRTIQVYIGNHVPPPPGPVPELMEELLQFANRSDIDPVVQAAWAHLQFETVHPFADGNGRTGRALINRILRSPLPLSVYIFRERPEYYRLLAQQQENRRRGWLRYLEWFTQGVNDQLPRLLPDTAPATEPPPQTPDTGR